MKKRHIEKIFSGRSQKKPEWYCESCELSPEDQKWIWDNIPAEPQISQRIIKKKKNLSVNANVSVNESVNDTCKRRVNFELTQSKRRAITELKQCNYRTPLIKVINILEELFKNCNSRKGHWAYIAQKWTVRAINWTLASMTKMHGLDWKTIENPAKYFTFLIKKRKRKKEDSKHQ